MRGKRDGTAGGRATRRLRRADQRRCLAVVDSLGIGASSDLTDVYARVEERTGTPLTVLEHAFPPGGPSGIWVASARANYVFFEKHTGQLHRAHIIFHELGHILLDHSCPLPVPEGAGDEAAVPVSTVLRRAHEDTVHEQEAECIARAISERVRRYGTFASAGIETVDDRALRRVAAELGATD